MIQLIGDVSVAQPIGSIDAASAKAAGIVGWFVRAEYGVKIDASFHGWADWVVENDFKLGVYSFQITDADPDDEVDALVPELARYTLDFGVALDIETRNNASPGNITTWSLGYADRMEQALGQPFGPFYTGPGFWTSLGIVAQAPDFLKRKLWVAHYGVSVPMACPPWAKWGQPGGPVLHQRWGNTIWQDQATKQQKWGKAQPGPGYVRIASGFSAPWSKCEVDVSQLPGPDYTPLLVDPPSVP
jgi:Glycosyl hydrolases family 25